MAQASELDRTPVYDVPATVENVVRLMKGEKPKQPER